MSLVIFSELDTRIKKMCKEKREQWLNLESSEIEQTDESNPRAMAEQIRDLVGRKRSSNTGTEIFQRTDRSATKLKRVCRRVV